MRHAKSSWDQPELPDHERPLNGRGRAAAAAMGEAMRGLGLAPDMVLVSTARRTLQTLEALEPWDETPLIEPIDTLYLATAAHLLTVLRGVTETTRSVLLLGHNPGLHDLACQLMGDDAARFANPDAQALTEGFPTGALAEFSLPHPWHALDAGTARLTRLIRPRDLPEAPHSRD
jgi:phosphohistidine phosphatase